MEVISFEQWCALLMSPTVETALLNGLELSLYSPSGECVHRSPLDDTLGEQLALWLSDHDWQELGGNEDSLRVWGRGEIFCPDGLAVAVGHGVLSELAGRFLSAVGALGKNILVVAPWEKDASVIMALSDNETLRVQWVGEGFRLDDSIPVIGGVDGLPSGSRVLVPKVEDVSLDSGLWRKCGMVVFQPGASIRQGALRLEKLVGGNGLSGHHPIGQFEVAVFVCRDGDSFVVSEIVELKTSLAGEVGINTVFLRQIEEHGAYLEHVNEPDCIPALAAAGFWELAGELEAFETMGIPLEDGPDEFGEDLGESCLGHNEEDVVGHFETTDVPVSTQEMDPAEVTKPSRPVGSPQVEVDADPGWMLDMMLPGEAETADSELAGESARDEDAAVMEATYGLGPPTRPR